MSSERRIEPRLHRLAILVLILGVLAVIFAIRYVHHRAFEQNPKATLQPEQVSDATRQFLAALASGALSGQFTLSLARYFSQRHGLAVHM